MEFIHICTPNAQLCHKLIVSHTGVICCNVGGFTVGSATLSDMEIQVEFRTFRGIVIGVCGHLTPTTVKLNRVVQFVALPFDVFAGVAANCLTESGAGDGFGGQLYIHHIVVGCLIRQLHNITDASVQSGDALDVIHAGIRNPGRINIGLTNPQIVKVGIHIFQLRLVVFCIHYPLLPGLVAICTGLCLSTGIVVVRAGKGCPLSPIVCCGVDRQRFCLCVAAKNTNSFAVALVDTGGCIDFIPVAPAMGTCIDGFLCIGAVVVCLLVECFYKSIAGIRFKGYCGNHLTGSNRRILCKAKGNRAVFIGPTEHIRFTFHPYKAHNRRIVSNDVKSVVGPCIRSKFHGGIFTLLCQKLCFGGIENATGLGNRTGFCNSIFVLRTLIRICRSQLGYTTQRTIDIAGILIQHHQTA